MLFFAYKVVVVVDVVLFASLVLLLTKQINYLHKTLGPIKYLANFRE